MIGGSVSYWNQKPDRTYTGITQGSENKYFGVGLNPAIAYAITPKVHIETGLNNLFYVGYLKAT